MLSPYSDCSATIYNLFVNGSEWLSDYQGNSAGDRKETLELACPNSGSDGGVMVGINIKRYHKDDGDKDRYTFQIVCR